MASEESLKILNMRKGSSAVDNDGKPGSIIARQPYYEVITGIQ